MRAQRWKTACTANRWQATASSLSLCRILSFSSSLSFFFFPQALCLLTRSLGCLLISLALLFFGISHALRFFHHSLHDGLFVLFFFTSIFRITLLVHSLLNTIGLATLGLHLTHSFFVHGNVTVHHHLFEEHKVLNCHYLLQQTFVNALLSA